MSAGEQLTLPGGHQVPGHVLSVFRNAHWRGGVHWRARCTCGWYGADETIKARAEARGFGHAMFAAGATERNGHDG